MTSRDAPRGGDASAVSDRYLPHQDRELSDIVLQAIAERNGADLTESDFTLYEYVDPDALDELFRHSASNMMVEFTVPGLHVRCWTDHSVKIQVTDSKDPSR